MLRLSRTGWNLKSRHTVFYTHSQKCFFDFSTNKPQWMCSLSNGVLLSPVVQENVLTGAGGRIMIWEHSLVSESSKESDSQFLIFQKELGQSIRIAEPCPFSFVWTGGAGGRTTLNCTCRENRTEGQRSQHGWAGSDLALPHPPGSVLTWWHPRCHWVPPACHSL